MFFLIEYNRKKGRIVSQRTFADSEWALANQERLELELDLNQRGVRHEVVILEADNEKTIRRTHRRYFETLSELISLPA